MAQLGPDKDGMAVGFTYRILRRLGKGGMAEVFLARQMGPAGVSRLVVIKRLLPQYSESKEVMQMLLDEARITIQLCHPNIVQLLELGQEQGQLFIVMEYVDGCDLATLARIERHRHSRIPLRLTLHILGEAALGLAHAHKQVSHEDGRPLNLVHRDVSPHNVLCGREGLVKITDFGISKFTGKTHLTQVGVVKGKVQYMSPEQYRGAPVDHRSDLYSMGVVLYQLTTGKLPRVDEAGRLDMKRVIDGRVPRPTDLCPDYPEALEAIVMRALSVRPDERQADAEELREDLLYFARDHDLLASPREVGDYVERLVPALSPVESEALWEGDDAASGEARARVVQPRESSRSDAEGVHSDEGRGPKSASSTESPPDLFASLSANWGDIPEVTGPLSPAEALAEFLRAAGQRGHGGSGGGQGLGDSSDSDDFDIEVLAPGGEVPRTLPEDGEAASRHPSDGEDPQRARRPDAASSDAPSPRRVEPVAGAVMDSASLDDGRSGDEAFPCRTLDLTPGRAGPLALVESGLKSTASGEVSARAVHLPSVKPASSEARSRTPSGRRADGATPTRTQFLRRPRISRLGLGAAVVVLGLLAGLVFLFPRFGTGPSDRGGAGPGDPPAPRSSGAGQASGSDRKAPRETRVPEPGGQPRPAVPSPRFARGVINVEANPPEAEVLLDRQVRCASTPCQIAGLPLGRSMTLELRAGGRAPWSRTLVLSPEEPRLLLSADLSPLPETPALVKAEKAPPAAVQPRSTAPVKPNPAHGPAQAATSRPAPTVEAPDPPPEPEGSAAAMPPAPVSSLQVQPASKGRTLLAVDVQPWAEVILDGQTLGHTPLQIVVAPGRHQLVLRNTEIRYRKSFPLFIKAGTRVKVADQAGQ